MVIACSKNENLYTAFYCFVLILILNSTNLIEQKYVKNINPKILIVFFVKKMLIKILLKF